MTYLAIRLETFLCCFGHFSEMGKKLEFEQKLSMPKENKKENGRFRIKIVLYIF